MLKQHLSLLLLFFITFTSCDKSVTSTDAADSYAAGGLTSSASGGRSGSGGSGSQAGVITAGEWNDLDNWKFWDTLIIKDDFKKFQPYWSFYNNNRIAVKVTGANNLPVINAVVKLKRNGNVIFSTKTDNKGAAELWGDLFAENSSTTTSGLSVDVGNGAVTLANVKPYKEGVNNITTSPLAVKNRIEVAFVVDATGSMGDELEYLKTELLDVISQVKSSNPGAEIATSAVFYRDHGDEYLTKVSPFTSDANATINFIKDQRAGGGGDIPEAVDAALDKAVNELQWSGDAKTRLLFLLLDAPPHHEQNVIGSVQTSISKAAANGIKVIPIAASGTDKETEFLLRFMAMSTNGTYVFITNDSGIGNTHMAASVGPYTVEYLNNLMIRLINKYAQ
jgi:Mg-chelatase subunit ChlD